MTETPDQPENLVLHLLREIRAKQDEHDRRFSEHDKHFKDMRKDIEDMKTQIVFALGTTTSNHLRTSELEAWRAEAERRQRDVEALMDDIHRRLKQDPHP
jgi:ABC-type Fe3+-citrate transport system substrate-binding protein